MWNHVLVVALRLAYCALIVVALPESHMRWSESLQRGDIEGQKAMGFIMIFFLIGFAAGGIFLFTTTLAHCFLHKWPWKVAALDGLLFVAISGLLIYAGVNAEYK